MVQLSTIENLIRQYVAFKDIRIDQVLFEADYPILFSGRSGHDEYLFVCPLANQDEVVWISAKVDPNDVIAMLQNKKTIREMFTSEGVERHLIRFNGRTISGRAVSLRDIPDELLPTPGEYMDAEAGEYDEEIEYYRQRKEYGMLAIKYWILYPVVARDYMIHMGTNHTSELKHDFNSGRYWTEELTASHLMARMEA